MLNHYFYIDMLKYEKVSDVQVTRLINALVQKSMTKDKSTIKLLRYMPILDNDNVIDKINFESVWSEFADRIIQMNNGVEEKRDELTNMINALQRELDSIGNDPVYDNYKNKLDRKITMLRIERIRANANVNTYNNKKSRYERNINIVKNIKYKSETFTTKKTNYDIDADIFEQVPSNYDKIFEQTIQSIKFNFILINFIIKTNTVNMLTDTDT